MLLSSISALAQNYEDVVYLKNGSIIRGTIVEKDPNANVKIETKDGSLFVYPYSEVERTAQEESRGGQGLANLTNPMDEESVEKLLSERKDPLISFILSFFILGSGQIYNGDIGKGVSVILATGTSTLIASGVIVFGSLNQQQPGIIPTSLTVAALTLIAIPIVWSWVDAPLSAIEKNKAISRKLSRLTSYNDLLNFPTEDGNVVGLDLGFNEKMDAGVFKVSYYF